MSGRQFPLETDREDGISIFVIEHYVKINFLFCERILYIINLQIRLSFLKHENYRVINVFVSLSYDAIVDCQQDLENLKEGYRMKDQMRM